MGYVLLILFFAVPLFEIWLLIKVGGWLGAVPTIGLVVFTAVLGALLLRWQGFGILNRVRLMMARGELPAIEMLEGVMLVFCGALLLTPGFFTDAIGFLLMIPPLRRQAVLWLVSRSLFVYRPPPDGDRRPGPRTIEGEFWREKDRRDQ
jgi:UPF0716 protein FxsA